MENYKIHRRRQRFCDLSGKPTFKSTDRMHDQKWFVHAAKPHSPLLRRHRHAIVVQNLWQTTPNNGAKVTSQRVSTTQGAFLTGESAGRPTTSCSGSELKRRRDSACHEKNTKHGSGSGDGERRGHNLNRTQLKPSTY